MKCVMKFEDIKNIMEYCDNSTLHSFHYCDQTFELSFSKNSLGKVMSSNKNEEDNTYSYLETENISTEDKDNIVSISSPFVGQLEYSEILKQKSNLVEKEDVLFTIEAMKLVNEIKSPVKGTILEVLKKNGSMVEYGENILRIKVDMDEK